jgi:predicted transcriptional regulator
VSEERDWAKFYQEHRDDPDMWGEPEEEAQAAPKSGLSATVTVRFSPEEASEMRRWAKKLDLTYSTLVRTAVRTFVQNASMIERSVSGPLAEYERARKAAQGRGEVSLTNYRTSTSPLALTP